MIFLWLWLAGALLAVVPIARTALTEIVSPAHPPERADYAGAAAIGVVAAPLWPLVIVIWGVYLMIRPKEDA